jgi:phosphate:Na+ symporter
MSATEVVVRLLGLVSLLLWGIHMVNSGVLRAYGGPLRQGMASRLDSRPRALLFGAGVTLALQSSTATAMMATAFAESGSIPLAAALAAMLGANIGSALIVQLFSFDVSLVFPVFLFVGLAAFRRGERSRVRDIGRALMGVGLILLSLRLLSDTMRPVEGAEDIRQLLIALTRDPLLNLALAAALTWAAHSSVAVVLFVGSLCAAGVVTPEASLAMTLGANLGSALNPLIEAGGGNRAKRRLAVGNFANRVVGCLIFLPLIGFLARRFAIAGVAGAEAPAAFHLIFNVAMALIALPLLPRLERGLVWAFADAPDPLDPATPRYLLGSAADAPVVALTNAAREALRLADGLEALLGA